MTASGGNVTNLPLEQLVDAEEPVLLYNDSYESWVTVSSEEDRGGQKVIALNSAGDTMNKFLVQRADNDMYKLYNINYGQWLYLSSTKLKNDRIISTSPDPQKEGNLFKIEDKGNGSYLLWCQEDEVIVYVSCESAKDEGGYYILSHPNNPDQRNLFTFQLAGDAVGINLDYDLANAKQGTPVPTVIATNTVFNNSDTVQTTNFVAKESVTESSSFQNTKGFSLKVGTSFSGGIPFIINEKVEVDATTSTQFTWGKETSVTKSFSSTVITNACSHTKTVSEALVTKNTLDVPYTMTAKTKTGNTFKSSGMWKGVSHYDLNFHVTSTPLSGSPAKSRWW